MTAAAILATALRLFAPDYLDEATAASHVSAASSAALATGIPATLLLAIAYVESRYDPRTVSRMECRDGACKRATGVWSQDTRPPASRPTYYCGVTQVGGDVSWERCVELRDLALAYATGAEHLVEWMDSPPCRRLAYDERLVCGLRGYNGGWAAIKSKATVYPRMVLGAQRNIEKLIVE